MESIRDFGLFDDFSEDEIHPLQIDDYESEEDMRQKLTDTKTNIYKPEKGETLLHRAIRSGNKFEINVLLAAYQSDFDKVRDYVVSKYQWDPSDKLWLRKNILIAASEDQCRSAKQLENRQLSKENLTHAVFVLLLIPIDEEEVAVIHPDETTSLAAVQLISGLIPNGLLTWNSVCTEKTRETFMEIAASCGRTDIIQQLFDLGAEIAIPDHNALLAACRRLQKNTIRWLLTEHFDHFDCTTRDSGQHNALIILMQKRNEELFDFVLKRMIAYRQKYYNESESEAFNMIFRFENAEYTCLSILTYVGKGPLLAKIEQCIVKYKLDLFYQWENVTTLACLLGRKLAVEYCLDGIRENPDLLGLVDYGCQTILQCLIDWGYLDFLVEMYKLKPEVKKYFETDGSFTTMQKAIYGGNRDTVQFLAAHHLTFLQENSEKMREAMGCGLKASDSLREVLFEHFPELQSNIGELDSSKPVYYKDDIEAAFSSLAIDFSASPLKVQSTQPLHSIRGANGETLLHLAVAKNDAVFFTELLEGGVNPDALDSDGNHAVHYVQDIPMLDLLIDRYPEGKKLVNLTNSDGNALIHRLCSRYLERKLLTSLLEKVIDCGADVNQLNNSGESPLFMASSCTVLDALEKYGVKLDIVSKKGETAFLRHVRNRHTCMVTALLPLVHELPSFKEHAHECLSLMIRSRSLDTFYCDYQRFLEKYPATTKLLFDSAYAHSREDASRLFADACSKALNFAVEKFLDYDYDLDYNHKDDYEYTPIIGLLSYMEENNVHLVKRLLEKGVDLETRNSWGRNALLTLVERFRSAKWYGHSVETVQLLLDHGANVNATDSNGNTALHLAFSSSELELVESLIRNGGDLKARNKDGKVPCQMGSRLNQELFYFMV
ncbi:transient receptor potential cation channel subfamily A member 1-like [Topomyia yanbarensis]|uniref:transient receptor potential cation channel subfamily A member 1-like n=1 Tax=Topomyia yanbarensis TaxID=2498891 RepID=UPI00273B88F4|nr:transient receptor potential cation channel subfamily A member 1-like [Topomyia yanbarensis]